MKVQSMTEQLTHPSPEQLKAFNVGRLSDEDAEAVETHIDECQPCCETVLGLSADDTFVALLQDANESPIDEISGQLAKTQDTSAMDDGEIPPELVHHSRYTIIGPVGKGGMGDVFKAEHRMMERMVALKVIKRELFSRPEAVQRFHREVKTAARLSHPNIVTAFDAEQAGDVHFLVMEYVDGVDLARSVKVDGPLSITEACDYIRQAARGLQHAHEQGMVHRDIKPHNLMLSGDGTVKILDFGLATLATEVITTEASGEQSQNEPVSRKTSRLTTLGTMMGTPDFISPEQAGEPRAADIRSDIYSLGCTFFYLLTGRPPFTEGSAMEKVKAHGVLEPEPIENVRGDVPPELADIVRRMMAKQPAERFQTPDELSDALATFAAATRAMPGVGKPDDFRLSPAPSRASSRWPPTVLPSLVLGAFALIFATIIYVATDGGTLVVDSDDESVEVTVHPVSKGSNDVEKVRLGIADTITGSTVKWFRRGEYAVALKGTENEFELSQDRFVLKRGDNVIVKVERKKHSPSSPAGLARERRDPFPVPDVKRSTPHNSELLDDRAVPLNLDNGDAATMEKLKQSADVMYADVALEEVLDDISTKYDIAFDTRAIAGTDAKVVLAMMGFPLESVLETILRGTNLHCDAEGSVMVIRTSDATSPRVSPTSERSRDERDSSADQSGKVVDPFAK